jgi:hypothetical protein
VEGASAGAPSAEGGPGGGGGLTAGGSVTPPIAGAPFAEGGPGVSNAGGSNTPPFVPVSFVKGSPRGDGGGSTPIARMRDRLSHTRQNQARATLSMQNIQPADLVNFFLTKKKLSDTFLK